MENGISVEIKTEKPCTDNGRKKEEVANVLLFLQHSQAIFSPVVQP
jgi:hypothetical protein